MCLESSSHVSIFIIYKEKVLVTRFYVLSIISSCVQPDTDTAVWRLSLVFYRKCNHYLNSAITRKNPFAPSLFKIHLRRINLNYTVGLLGLIITLTYVNRSEGNLYENTIGCILRNIDLLKLHSHQALALGKEAIFERYPKRQSL